MTTTTIVLFLVFGACFGLASFSNRHLFSEGSTRRGQAADDTWGARLLWLLICSALWPILALTGMVSMWRRRRVRAADSDDDARGPSR
jgi:hypothetical protein